MQLFFWLPRNGTAELSWSKKKFAEKVTSYIESLPGAQTRCLMEDGLGWDSYLALITVEDKKEALTIRKTVEGLCKEVKKGCKPYYFRVRKKHVEDLADLTLFGLTREENEVFKAKAPPGEYRSIDV